jgi:histidinol-phosphatase
MTRAASHPLPGDPARWLALLMEAADLADAIARQHFRQPDLGIERKPDRSPVTTADRAIEAAVRALVQQREPALGILGEEQGLTAGTGAVRFILDPIDSTRNFARGIPIFATLLAIEAAGEIVAGMISAPALNTRWHALRGRGAFRDDSPIHVSAIAGLADAQLLHGDLSGCAEGEPPAGLSRLMRRVERTRGFGDFYQHVLVAEGAAEIAVDPVVAPWDVAALLILVEEAGGRASSLDGRRTIDAGSFITTNGHLHDEVLASLRSAAE